MVRCASASYCLCRGSQSKLLKMFFIGCPWLFTLTVRETETLLKIKPSEESGSQMGIDLKVTPSLCMEAHKDFNNYSGPWMGVVARETWMGWNPAFDWWNAPHPPDGRCLLWIRVEMVHH